MQTENIALNQGSLYEISRSKCKSLFYLKSLHHGEVKIIQIKQIPYESKNDNTKVVLCFYEGSAHRQYKLTALSAPSSIYRSTIVFFQGFSKQTKQKIPQNTQLYCQ